MTNESTSPSDKSSWYVFAGIWCVCAAVYSLLRWSHLLSEDISNGAIEFVASGYPILSSDFSIIGEVTPAIAAGLMVIFAPRQPETGRILAYISFYVVLYMFYVEFTLFASEANPILESALGGPRKEDLVDSLSAFAGNIRQFSIMTATALGGYWLQPRREARISSTRVVG